MSLGALSPCVVLRIRRASAPKATSLGEVQREQGQNLYPLFLHPSLCTSELRIREALILPALEGLLNVEI